MHPRSFVPRRSRRRCRSRSQPVGPRKTRRRREPGGPRAAPAASKSCADGTGERANRRRPIPDRALWLGPIRLALSSRRELDGPRSYESTAPRQTSSAVSPDPGGEHQCADSDVAKPLLFTSVSWVDEVKPGSVLLILVGRPWTRGTSWVRAVRIGLARRRRDQRIWLLGRGRIERRLDRSLLLARDGGGRDADPSDPDPFVTSCSRHTFSPRAGPRHVVVTRSVWRAASKRVSTSFQLTTFQMASK